MKKALIYGKTYQLNQFYHYDEIEDLGIEEPDNEVGFYMGKEEVDVDGYTLSIVKTSKGVSIINIKKN